jgi:hypothetical protein
MLLNPCKIWGPDGVEGCRRGFVGYGTILKSDRRGQIFRRNKSYCFRFQRQIEATYIPETLEPLYQTARCNNP